MDIPCLHHRAKQIKLDMDNANGNRSGSKLSAGVTASSNKVLFQGYDTHKKLCTRFQITHDFSLDFCMQFLVHKSINYMGNYVCNFTVIY